MTPKRISFILTFVMLSNPWNTILELTHFVGSHIPLSNHIQGEINKVRHLLMIIQEWMNRKFFPMDENLPKDKNYWRTGDTRSP